MKTYEIEAGRIVEKEDSYVDEEESMVGFNLIAVGVADIDIGYESFTCSETFIGAVQSLIDCLNRDGIETDDDKNYYYTLENDGMYRFYTAEALAKNNIWIPVYLELHDGTLVQKEALYNTVIGFFSEGSIRNENYTHEDVKLAATILPSGEMRDVEVDEHNDFLIL